VQFADVTSAAGLDFVNVSGSVERRPEYIVETQSAGAAFLDYDGDGFLDLFVVNGSRLGEEPPGDANRLFRNEASGDGQSRVFRETTTEAGLEARGWGMGCAVGDYDNDGDPDLYVSYWGPNQLYRNEGDGRFVAVAEEAGVGDDGWGSSAAFGDLDGDGWLDLYVVNYLRFDLANPPGQGRPGSYKGMEVYFGPAGMEPQADVLYRNSADGRFVDMSRHTGIAGYPYPSLGVAFADCDADGDLDIYVANDSEPNLLFRNDGQWQFTEIGTSAGVAYTGDGREQAGMGVTFGDYDNDGDLDLYVTNFSDDVNTLYQNEGGGVFSDATNAAGLSGVVRPFLGWGTGFLDFDNDGWLDLFAANGHLYPQLDQRPSGLRYVQRNLLYRNQQGRFAEMGEEAGPGWAVEKSSRAAALGDYDNDGDVDLLVMNLNDRPTLLRNEGGNIHNWLGLELVGRESNRDAIGAQVLVVAGELSQLREVQRGYGFQAQHDPRLIFGLGCRQRVERVEIRWPSGQEQVLEDPPMRRYLVVREGSDDLLAGPRVPPPAAGEIVLKRSAKKPTVAVLVPSEDRSGWTRQEYLEAINELYKNGRYGEARALVEQALQSHPEYLPFHVNLGIVYYAGLGEYQRASVALEEAVARAPDQADIHFLLGQVYLAQNRPERATAILRKAVDLLPTYWEYRHWLGVAHVRADSLRAAARAFQQAVKRAPRETRPHLQLARVYDALGQTGAAQRELQVFRRLLSLQQEVERHQRQVAEHPQDARLRSRLGWAHVGQGNLDEALEHFRQALELDPQQGLAHYGTGGVLHAQNKLDQAIHAYEQACRLRPDLAEWSNDLGRAYLEAGHHGKAMAAFRQALELKPGLALVHSNMADVHAAQGHLVEAIHSYEAALEIDSTMVKARDALGRAYASQGRLSDAIQEWERLLSLKPDHPYAAAWIRKARETLARQ